MTVILFHNAGDVGCPRRFRIVADLEGVSNLGNGAAGQTNFRMRRDSGLGRFLIG